MKANTANNETLRHYGRRFVHGWFKDDKGGMLATAINFHVFDVKKPLVSTGRLRRNGFTTMLGDKMTIRKGHRSVPGDEANYVPFANFYLADKAHKVMQVAPH